MPSYNYPFIFDDEDGVHRPLVPVEIVNPDTNESVIVHCLIDTGADACVMPKFLATETGHNLKHKNVERTKTIGAGNKEVICYKHSFILKLLTSDGEKCIWKTKKSLISCVDHNGIPPILGWDEVLRHLCIKFDYKNDGVTITI